MRQAFWILFLAGCAGVPKTAIVDGKQVPRLTLEFSGRPYTVKHEGAHPQPRGPSSGLKSPGGAITGRVCGMFVDFDVEHKGDHVQLVGSLDNHFPVALDVRDENGARHFTGNLGGLAVDFELTGTTLQGHVGLRVIAVEARGDVFQGWIRTPRLISRTGNQGVMPLTVYGRSALWAMPAADQLAVLPSLLTCQSSIDVSHVVSPLTVGLGGQYADAPPETSTVYSDGRGKGGLRRGR